MAEEAFDSMGLSEIRLEVFNHNLRAIAAYSRVGFEVTGEHVEWVPRRKTELRVIEMRLSRDAFLASGDGDADDSQTQDQGGAKASGAATAAERAQRNSGEANGGTRWPTGTNRNGVMTGAETVVGSGAS